jgi:hypothetical protein
MVPLRFGATLARATRSLASIARHHRAFFLPFSVVRITSHVWFEMKKSPNEAAYPLPAFLLPKNGAKIQARNKSPTPAATISDQ